MISYREIKGPALGRRRAPATRNEPVIGHPCEQIRPLAVASTPQAA